MLLTKVSLIILGHPITCQSRSTNHLWIPPRVSKLQNDDNIYCCFVCYVPWLHKVHYMPTNLQALGYWEYHWWNLTNALLDLFWYMQWWRGKLLQFQKFHKTLPELGGRNWSCTRPPRYRGNRAEHGAIQMWRSWKILLQVGNRRKNNTLKTPATECACKGILSSLLMCPTSWKIIKSNCAKFLK